MKVSRSDIRSWLERAQEEGATHVVIRSDDFSHEYYPVTCFSEASAREQAARTGNMQRTIEVYNLSEDWDEQLDTPRCMNF